MIASPDYFLNPDLIQFLDFLSILKPDFGFQIQILNRISD
jgi:hypothetical protein